MNELIIKQISESALKIILEVDKKIGDSIFDVKSHSLIESRIDQMIVNKLDRKIGEV